MSETPRSPATARFGILALSGVLLLSASLYLWNINFPYGYHYDELKKVPFVVTNTQDFRHPLLLLQVARAVNGFLHLDRPEHIVLLGRMLTATYALLLVVFFYMLVRRLLPFPYDILATLALATSPILVVHAHYFKEDVLLTWLCLLWLLVLFRFIEQPGRLNGVLLGIATGLAVSAHYKALLLLVLSAALLGIVRGLRPGFHRRLLLAAPVALVTFLIINYPLIPQFGQFQQGLMGSFEEVTDGHSLRIYPIPHWFSFHLINSLVPGMTGVATLVALGSLAYFIIRRRLSWQEKILVLYLLLFHAVIELSPSKPPPGFIRYVLPEVPILIYFAFKGLRALDHASFRGATVIARALVVVAVIVPLQSAVRLDYHLNRDTRERVRAYIAEQAQPTIFERYAAAEMDVISATEVDLEAARQRGVAFLVASSFQYERYLYGSTLTNQDPDVYRLSCAYQKLFSYPYVEFTPAYRSFAFSNPTIRAIDIRAPQVVATGPPCGGNS